MDEKRKKLEQEYQEVLDLEETHYYLVRKNNSMYFNSKNIEDDLYYFVDKESLECLPQGYQKILYDHTFSPYIVAKENNQYYFLDRKTLKPVDNNKYEVIFVDKFITKTYIVNSATGSSILNPNNLEKMHYKIPKDYEKVTNYTPKEENVADLPYDDCLEILIKEYDNLLRDQDLNTNIPYEKELEILQFIASICDKKNRTNYIGNNIDLAIEIISSAIDISKEKNEITIIEIVKAIKNNKYLKEKERITFATTAFETWSVTEPTPHL